MFKDFFRRRAPTPTAAAPLASDEEARQWIRDGNAAEDAGRLPEALELYRRALERAPDLPAAHLNLGIALAATGEQAAAERSYERVLQLEPANPFACYNLALLCYGRQQLQRADDLVRRALSAKPEFPQAHLLRSNILDDQDQTDAALLATREALRLAPEYAGAHHNLALLLKKLGNPEAALASVQRALQLGASGAEMYALYADLLAQQGLVEEALQAIRSTPEDSGPGAELALSKQLFYASFDENAQPAETFARHRAYGRMVEAARPAYAHAADPLQQDRRLRVGYVSGDFRVHPVALFLLPVLERHRREAFEVFCYASGDKRDHFTARLEALADHWSDVRLLSDEALARKLHEDRIDILVDLSGHSGAPRLGAFAFKPAPVQVSWLGYLNTTGLTRMDYRLCDARTDPPGQSAALHTEKLLYLPHSQWCYRPFLPLQGAGRPPVADQGFVTFASFNQAAKVTPAMVRRWAGILRRVSRSRLLLADVSAPAKRQRILDGMAEGGVDASRIEFLPRVDVASYYRLFDRADIALDTYPYTGGTTSFDALAHGVPVLTAKGPTSCSRSAASILEPLGLQDWIAEDIEGYVELAVRHAADAERLQVLRRELPQRLAASPFMDEARFVRELEKVYRQAWQAHCTGG